MATTSFIYELYRLVLDRNVSTAAFFKLPGMDPGAEFGIKVVTENGIYPIANWIQHMPSTTTTRPQTFFGKMRHYGFIEMPRRTLDTDPNTDEPATKRSRVRIDTKLFYHRHFQPGRVDWLDRIVSTSRLRSEATKADEEQGLATRGSVRRLIQELQQARAKIIDLELKVGSSKSREAFLLASVHQRDVALAHMRQRLVASETHIYAITDEDGKPVAGEHEDEVTSKHILPSDLQAAEPCTTPTSVAADIDTQPDPSVGEHDPLPGPPGSKPLAESQSGGDDFDQLMQELVGGF